MLRKLMVIVLVVFCTYLGGCSMLAGTPFEKIGANLPDLPLIDKIVNMITGKTKIEEAYKNYPKDIKDVVIIAIESKENDKLARIYFSGDESFNSFQKYAKNLKGKPEIFYKDEKKDSGWVGVRVGSDKLLFELWKDEVNPEWKIISVQPYTAGLVLE